MSELTTDPSLQANLRQQAQQQLVAGIAPASRSWGISVEALAMLHRLASSPSSAADALKLLHELQVHQVELDLQEAQIETNEREMAGELAHYRALFQHAPLAQFVLDADGRIEACNRAGVALLGAPIAGVEGRPFGEFLTPDSRPQLAELLAAAQAGAARAAATLCPRPDSGASQSWRIEACAVEAGDTLLLVVHQGAGSPDG